MFNARKYTQSETIGQLRTQVTFFTPVRSLTTHLGQRLQWLEWTTTKAHVENIRGNEDVESDRMVALNSKRFFVRRMAVPNLSEIMMLTLNGEQYMITRIDPDAQNKPFKMYLIIEATRRDEQIQPVEFLANNMYMSWSQRWENQTANYVTVTRGTILSITDNAISLINQRLFVFRNGLRLVYGETGDGGYTIDNANNRITPNMKLMGENLLIHQYDITA